MTLSKTIAVTIWAFSIALYASFTFPESYLHGYSLSRHYFVLALPVLLSAMFAYKGKGYPFDLPFLETKIDAQWGAGTYANFIADVKPLMLFGISGIVCGCRQLVLAYQQQDGRLFFLAAFMFSAGVSFFVTRVILKKRGLLMEVRQTA